MKYYSNKRLLSMKDINGNTPEIFICTSNRSAGKTVEFNRFCVDEFLKGNGKFCCLYRYNYELDDSADQFFKEIGNLFYSGMEMKSLRRSSGMYHEFFLNDKSCGYAIALNNADTIKKKSHFFADVNRIIFDEFQSETNHYCPNEISKFISIHNSIARGGGKQSRYLPVYMIGNPVSLLNPYYTALKISSRLRPDTKFLKGEGFVLEQGFNESASVAQKNSLFNKAFSEENYTQYSSQGLYLNDNKAFIEKPSGGSVYLCTLKYNNKLFAIREYTETGIIYCDDRADNTFKGRICVTTDDHDINYVMLKRHDIFISNMRFFFEKGCFRFKNLSCKDAILNMISY